MKHFEWREDFTHKEDAENLANIIRGNGRKARIVKSGEKYKVYQGLLFARIKGYNEEVK
jgi:hypothetical protein